ncbi:cupin domain-containing protein [Amycolatopsis sp. NPDC059657]|uniref:cupin domain-containing protein n=1 Tax=Amycolatopsis sp. NPDC059657 TaxID=3346899 RepID=UPI00366D7929
MPTPAEIIDHLGLVPLPVEGGLFAQSHRSSEASAIYYLLVPPATSARHRLDRLEIWVFHGGAPVAMTLEHPDGRVSRVTLGLDVATGQRPQVVVPAGVWQSASSLGAWSLMGTVVVPPYTDASVEFPP